MHYEVDRLPNRILIKNTMPVYHDYTIWNQLKHKTLRYSLITLLLIILGNSYGQTLEDYKIYSIVIEDIIKEWDNEWNRTTSVVLIEQMGSETKEIQDCINDLYEPDRTYRDWMLKYDTTTIHLIEMKQVEKALLDLKMNISDKPLLEKEKLTLNRPYSLITETDFNKFFKRDIAKGWTKFYKSFPNSSGTFSFSKIGYSNNIACLYFEHISGGLAGSGMIAILIKNNENWTVKTYIQIWIS